jgi:hypothetical protein
MIQSRFMPPPRVRLSEAQRGRSRTGCASFVRCESGHGPGGEMDLLFIVLIVVLVLALLGFFGRSYW